MTLYLIFGVGYFIGGLLYALYVPEHRNFMKSRFEEGFERYGVPIFITFTAIAAICSIVFWPIELLALAYRKFK